MSNCMNLQFCFPLMLLNQWISHFFHWFYLSWDNKFLLMFSKRILLTLPISLFDGLIRRHDGFDQKLSLWSFSVTQAGVSKSFLIRSLNLIFLAMCFASRLIDLCNFCSAFLYVLVAFSPKSFYVATLTFCKYCWSYQQKQIRL